MGEFVKFKEALSWDRLLEILRSLECSFDVKEYALNERIEGVANGLFMIENTFVFVDRAIPKEGAKKIRNSVIVTTHTLAEDFLESNIIMVDDPRKWYIKMLAYFDSEGLLEDFSSTLNIRAGIDPSAKVDTHAVIEEGVYIGKNVTVSAGSVIKKGTYISDNAIIRENCTVGCDGIALYKTKQNEVLRFPHVAGVYIGENVEIGANTVIARGTLINTRIDSDTVIGNLCNIGHGVSIGKKVWISVGSMIGGNTRIDEFATIGLGVRIKDNITIAANCTIGMGSVVTKSLSEGIAVFGNPAKPIRTLSVGPKR